MVQAPALSYEQISSDVSLKSEGRQDKRSCLSKLNQQFLASSVPNCFHNRKQYSQFKEDFFASEELPEISIHLVLLIENSDPPTIASK